MNRWSQWMGLALVVLFAWGAGSVQAGQKFTRSQAFDDWVLNCAENDDPKNSGKEHCVLQQRMLTEKGERIMTVNIVMAEKNDLLAVFTLPLGFFIPDGVKVAVDGAKSRDLEVAFCTQAGCVARIAVDDRFAAEMARGKQLKVAMITGDRTKKLEFPVSLKGISAGLKAIK